MNSFDYSVVGHKDVDPRESTTGIELEQSSDKATAGSESS
jgi:hypothetical protein